MRSKPYPLEAARKLRAQAQDVAALELSAARTRLSAAEAELARLAALGSELAERRRGLPAAESGAELALVGVYAARLAREQCAHRTLLQRAAAEAHGCARALRLAELRLSRAYAERELIERHHARFAADARRQAERAEEAELDDLIPHLFSR
jgi:hypothetical protein